MIQIDKKLAVKDTNPIATDKQFITLHNSGVFTENEQRWSNQCMLISIHQYLVEFLNIEINFSDLRRIAGLYNDTNHTMFDIDDVRFVNAINNIATHFDLNIRVYYVNNKGERRLSNFYHQFGNTNSNLVVSIASYGLHFELVVHNINPIIDLQIVDDRVSPFQPTISLAHICSNSIQNDHIDAIIVLKQDIALYDTNAISEQIKIVNQLISITTTALEQTRVDIEYFKKCDIEEETKISALAILFNTRNTLRLQLSSQEKLYQDFVKNDNVLSNKREILKILTRELDESLNR